MLLGRVAKLYHPPPLVQPLPPWSLAYSRAPPPCQKKNAISQTKQNAHTLKQSTTKKNTKNNKNQRKKYFACAHDLENSYKKQHRRRQRRRRRRRLLRQRRLRLQCEIQKKKEIGINEKLNYFYKYNTFLFLLLFI